MTRSDRGTRPGLRPGSWLELSIEADVEAVEAVSEILGRVAPAGTSVEPAFELVDEGLGARLDPARPATVRAYLPMGDEAATRQAVAEVATALGHLAAFGLRPIGELRTHEVQEGDWATAWKRHFPVLRVGRRLIIRPTWRRYRRTPGDVVIALDPGMAFGTGLHPTTRLCLAALEGFVDGMSQPPQRVLDVGCGSGILSIAAARLGAREVVGLDIDPIAVEASGANARRNHVTRRVRTRLGGLPSGAPPFDLVLANLVASVLSDLAAALHAELRPGGTLIASGIFVDREAEVRSSFERAGIRPVDRLAEGDWIALVARRPD